MPTKLTLLNTCLILTIVLFSCQKTELTEQVLQEARPAHAGFNQNDMVLTWNENVAKILAKTVGNPPYFSRHFTMTQIAVHDALNSIVPKFDTYALMNERVKDADPDAAVASAAYWSLKRIDAFLKSFPGGTGLALQTQGNDWEGWYAASLNQIPDGEAKTKGINLGMKSADAIMAKRANDGFALARPAYVNGSGLIPPAGIYRATIAQNPPIPFPTTHIGALPYWGIYMQGFAVSSADQFRVGAPPTLNSSVYSSDYNEVKTLGARIGSTRTAEQSLIANFWQEPTSNIMNRFAREAILNKKVDAWRSARLLALVNVAIFDGLLVSFESMYHYYRWRPESAIRGPQDDGNSSTTMQADWLPFATDIKIGPPPQTSTPPIPDYPNTNATATGATTVLALFFETDKTNVQLRTDDVITAGTVRSFSSFSEASKEYGESRIYAGFAFRYSIVAGDEIGRNVAKHAFENLLKEK